MKKGQYDKNPPFHRLTLDLDKETYNKLKVLAADTERSPSKQAKVILIEYIQKTKIHKN
jgi:hypothetical protein